MCKNLESGWYKKVEYFNMYLREYCVNRQKVIKYIKRIYQLFINLSLKT